jgi:hypothetical protein
MTLPGWTDKELLGYIDLHSRTERALLHIDHINRLLELAGRPRISGGGFYALHYEEAAPLIAEARRRLV